MNIQGLISQFRNEDSLRYGSSKKKEDKKYSIPDIEQFKLDMIAGATIKQSAINNNIPMGSAYRYVPDQLKKVRNKTLAAELATKKLNGTIKLSFVEIGKLCGYRRDAVREIFIKLEKQLVL
jgi:hypothetical protein